ncbi:MAG: type II toxin-antitoxin system VapC family toxin [Burkholderiaceae bacterium]
MYLLDTNVVSELRKSKPHGAVLSWVNSVDNADLYLSAVTVGELQTGVELTRAQDTSKAEEIELWVLEVCASFNVLPMDGTTFREWAKLMHGRSNVLYEDAMIAATAMQHRLTIATRNTKDFQVFDAPFFDPFTFKE